jgi:archaeosine synthase beta-subunit
MGTDLYQNEELPCLTVIFRSGGCSWKQCLMCGYRFERSRNKNRDELLAEMRGQLRWVAENYPPESYAMVKIFTSGSFFDPREVPPAFLDDVAALFAGKVVIAETRTEYVAEDVLTSFRENLEAGGNAAALYVAMGLETTNDYIRDKCIRKGHTFDDFKDAVETARRADVGIKTYLMMKPPYLTEREALADMKKSIREVIPYSDIISMNLCTIQTRTEVEQYWKQGSYRPPYLWSALDALLSTDHYVQCDPVGGGKRRGPHNCGECDYEIVDAINEYNRTGNKIHLKRCVDAGCACVEEWKYVLENEEPWCMPLTK